MTPIPRIIWINWFQGWADAPDLMKSCLRSWVEQNPGWDVRAVSNNSIAEHTDIVGRFPGTRGKYLSPQGFSDLLRVSLLSEHGGVWVDATLWCARSLDDWLPEVTPGGFFAFEKPAADRMVASWFLAATPGHPMLRRWAALCEDYWAERESPHDYFWFHSLFADAYRDDQAFRDDWDRTPKISAGPPHALQPEMAKTFTDDHLRLLEGRGQPVYKMASRFVGDAAPQTLYAAICHYWRDGILWPTPSPRRILLLWFGSIPGHGTIGDLLSVEAAAGALVAAGNEVDCATWLPVTGAVNITMDAVDAAKYDVVVFVCGPIMKEHPQLRDLIDTVSSRPMIAVGVSLFREGHWNHWDPFDSVLAREGTSAPFDDVAIAAPMPTLASSWSEQRTADASRTSVRVGLSLRGAQSEYSATLCLADRAEEVVQGILDGLAADRHVDVVRIENHLQRSGRPPDQIEELYAGCDLILTTRLHGATISARHGVPFIALDQIRGGAKVTGILGRYSWPHVYRVDDLDADELLLVAHRLLDSPGDQVSILREEMLSGAARTLRSLTAESLRVRGTSRHP